MKIKSFSKKLGQPPTFLKKRLKVNKAVTEEDGEVENEDSDWAVTDIAKVRDQLAVQRAQSGANRPPELYVKDGETKRLRFRDNEAIAGIWQYSLKVNGKWVSHTMPSDGQVNYYHKKGGLRPSFKVIYEVIDLDGYTDKNGKKIKNVPRFLKASGRLNEQLELVKSKRNGLTGFIVELKRTGQSTNTLYSVYPEDPSKTPPELLKIPRLRKDFRKYYAPLPPEQQKAVVGMMDTDTEDAFQ